MFKSPLAQYDVMTLIPIFLGNIDVSGTNLSMSLLIFLFLGIILLYVFYNENLMPSNWQLFLEAIFMFMFSLVYQLMGKSGLVYFPFMFALFSFILLLNLLSMTPYGFAVTSHMAWTIYFSLSICLGIFILGMLKHKINFFKLFVPEVPLFLYPLMITIEMLSYMMSSFSLAMSLSANMIAGHTLVHMLADFMVYLCSMKKLIVVLPFILLLAIFLLEFGVACLQAYMFVTLTCMYINEAIHVGAH